MKQLIRTAAILTSFAMFFLSCGCWGSKELRDLPIIVGMAVDKATTNPLDVTITEQIVKASSIKQGAESGGGSAREKEEKGHGIIAFRNVQATNASVLEGIRNLTQIVNNKLYSAHQQVIVIGMEQAKVGIRDVMDVHIRHLDARPTTLIFVSESTGYEILDTIPNIGAIPAINLVKLAKAQQMNSYSYLVSMQELVNMQLSASTSTVLPLVKVVINNDQRTLKMSGMAVFDKDRMIGTLNEKETRGLLWVKNLVKDALIDVRYADQSIKLDVSRSRTRIKPRLSQGKVVISIWIELRSILKEHMGTENLETEAGLKKLADLQSEEVKREIFASFEKAKLLHADIFGFGVLIHKWYPKQWKSMKDSWPAIFQDVQLEIKVESVIRDTGLIGKPISPESR